MQPGQGAGSKTLHKHWPLALILTAFLILGIAYAVTNPLFESPDEVWHYEYVRWLVEGKGLPRPEQVGEAPWHQEGSQPPLYYLISALLVSPIPTDNAVSVIRYNPHAAIGQPDSFGNKNAMVHGNAGAWPWQGVALSAHVARLFSLLLGGVTVIAAYGTALALFPARAAASAVRRWSIAVAALAAALVAFTPQFLFLSAAVNNDNLVIAASAGAVWLAVYMIGQRETETMLPPDAGPAGTTSPEETAATSTADSEAVPAAPKTWQLVLMGGLVGVAALAKLSGLAVAGLAALTLIIVAWRRRSTPSERWARSARSGGSRPSAGIRFLRDLLVWSFVVVAVALVLAGWWYVRNWQLYGDPLGLQAMFEILPRRPEPPTMAELVARAQGVWRSAWAVFGWFNVVADGWLYDVYTALSLVGLAGLVIAWPVRLYLDRQSRNEQFDPLAAPGRLKTDRTRSAGSAAPASASGAVSQQSRSTLLLQLLLLVIWSIVIFLALLNWAQMRYPQGRLLFPAISAVAVLASLGLVGWLPRRWWTALAAALGLPLFLLATLALVWWVAPAYRAPVPLDTATPLPNSNLLPGGAESAFNASEEALVRLVGYEFHITELRPGDQFLLTLYWQALQPLDRDLSVFVHLTDENGIVQAQRDSFPGAGNAPTSDWSVDLVIPDEHVVTIPDTAPAPHSLRVDVGLYDFATGERLTVGDKPPVSQAVAQPVPQEARDPSADHWTLGYVTLLPRGEPGDLPNPVAINFDDQIALTGFDFDRRVMAPGDTLELTLWWEALAEPELDYVVFTHLVLPPEAVWAGLDQMPQAGSSPTSSWQLGQRIEDHHRLTLPEEAPPGVYFVEIGLYDPANLDRLKVNFSDKGIVIGQVRVADK